MSVPGVPHSSLPSDVDSSPAYIPLRSWSPQEIARIQSRLQTLWLAWWKDWGPCNTAGSEGAEPPNPGVRVMSPEECHVAPEMETTLAVPHALQAWMFPGVQPAHRCGTEGVARTIAGQLLSQAWSAWCDALTDCLGSAHCLQSASLTGEAKIPWQPWSGSLWVVFPVGDSEWGLMLDAATVSHVLDLDKPRPGVHQATPVPRPTPPVAPLAQALNEQSVLVQVALQPLSLSLGQLQSLVSGDVIKLTQRLDQPADIYLDLSNPVDGHPDVAWQALGHVALGQVQGFRAVEWLTSSSSH